MLLGSKVTVYTDHKNLTFKSNDLFYSLTDSRHIMDCFSNIPSQTELPNPLAPSYIQKNQFEDSSLNNKKAQQPLHFPVKTFMNHDAIHYRSNPIDIDDMK